ncbi:MAG: aminodeoxychorismate/anthranilate synthase component II [Bacteroidales bacterium]|jgi:anthranilate synthase component 2|nr:aminodeoxychorismate/anthranilate synthase component II [Bacteroidales bacterium]
MKVLVIDNYDSFTYNLVHIIRKLGIEPVIARNDKISIEDVAKFDKIFLSPGPGLPDEAGILKEIIKTYAATKEIFGICLGQQAIAEVFGGNLVNLDKVYHGVATDIFIKKNDCIFENIPAVIKAGRYHSWVVDTATLPEELEITATDEQGQIMAVKHKHYNVVGVQFHPESIMTEMGEKIIENFLKN